MIDLNRIEEAAGRHAGDLEWAGADIAYQTHVTPQVVVEMVAMIRRQESELAKSHDEIEALKAARQPLADRFVAPGVKVDTPDVWTLSLDMGALVPNSPRQGDGRKRYWLVEDAISHTARAVAAAVKAHAAEWLIADPHAVLERVRTAGTALLDAAIKDLGTHDDNDLQRTSTEFDEALSACVGHMPVAGELPPLPKWIDDQKGKDPLMDDIIAYMEGHPVQRPSPVPLFDRKLADLEKRGYEVIGRILHKDGEYALFDSSCRWLTKPQYQRLMHEQNSKLFDQPVQQPAAFTGTGTVRHCVNAADGQPDSGRDAALADVIRKYWAGDCFKGISKSEAVEIERALAAHPAPSSDAGLTRQCAEYKERAESAEKKLEYKALNVRLAALGDEETDSGQDAALLVAVERMRRAHIAAKVPAKLPAFAEAHEYQAAVQALIEAALAAHPANGAQASPELLNIGSMMYQGRSVADWVIAAKGAQGGEKPFAHFVQPSGFGPFIECEPDQSGAFPAYRAAPQKKEG